MSGTLYLVATPIGNLSDISQRAIETLREVDIVACEDTRHTGKLLKHLGLKKQLLSFHEHNEEARLPFLIDELKAGKSIALVSDAGTPLISDPGYSLVTRLREEDIPVTSIPGPTALISALILSGLPTDSFFFGGFLPAKSGARRKKFEAVSNLDTTLIFYESPKRLPKSLADCAEVLGNRKAAVVRELTKVHEEVLTGHLDTLSLEVKGALFKGEIVLIIDRRSDDVRVEPHNLTTTLYEIFDRETGAGENPKQALKTAAKQCGLAKSEAYRLLEIRKAESQ